MSGTDRVADGLVGTSAAEAAEIVGRDDTLGVSGFGSVGYPKAVPEALAESGREFDLTVVSGGSVGREIDTLLVESGAVTRRFPYQSRAASRRAANSGEVAFHDRHVSHVADEVQYNGLASVDTAVVEAVAVGEDWLIPSTSVGQTPAFVEAADRLVVEVNGSVPRALETFHDVYRPGKPPDREPIPLTDPGGRIGSPRVSFAPEKLAAVVRTDRRDTPYEFRDPSAADERVAANLAGFLGDEMERNPIFDSSVNLQFGVGSLGNALMSALSDVEFGGRSVTYYGEVVQDGMLDMLTEGTLESASATSLALSREGQDRFFENTERFSDAVVLRPADVSNNPTLVDRFGVVAVNSALEVDVYGHVNSTHVRGSDVVNGIGGGGDFFRNAAVSVLALHSTAGGGEISRVVPLVSHVDHTEHDVDVVVTERGVADIRGLSPRERASEIVARCAHPRYRDELRSYLEGASAGGGHVPHDLRAAVRWFE